MHALAPIEPDEIPITPSAERWRAMSPADRDAHLLEVFAALEREELRAAEGLRHFKSKVGALSTLKGHFSRVGRKVFLACELAVLYPGERAFAPDLLAVLDVESPDDDDRDCWSVVDEGRGPDLVLEVHYKGDKTKDLVSNVARYARLGIPEYFVYDRAGQKLYGYRLRGGRYVTLTARLGQLGSEVLGLSLGILGGRLRFFSGDAMIPEHDEILGRLEQVIDEREREIASETRAREEAERAREEAQARVAALEAELAELRARLR